jgi:hypothetical protein
MQTGERELHLRLDARHVHDPAARCLPGQVIQQRRFAHARLAAQHQHPAFTRPDRRDQVGQRAHLAAPAP